MEKICNLTLCHTSFFDNRDSVILPDTLDVQFVSKYDLSNILVCVKNGEKKETIKAINGKVNLDAFLFAGKIEINVKMLACGEVVKEWELVPILVKEYEGTFQIKDLLKDIEDRLDALEQKTTIIM